jgi:bifunctional enzyme CysN/CysC
LSVVSMPLSGGTATTSCGRSATQGMATILLAHLRRSRSMTDVVPPFRMPVQWINRPHLDFRGVAGTVAAESCGPAIA